MSRLPGTSLLLAILLCGAAAAQGTSDPPRRPENGRRQQPPEQRDVRYLENLRTALKLDPERTAKFDGIVTDGRSMRSSLDDELRQGKAKVLQAVREGKSEEELQKLTKTQGETYAKISANEVWVMSRIYSLLNDDQKKIAEAAFARMESVTAQRPPGFPQFRQ